MAYDYSSTFLKPVRDKRTQTNTGRCELKIASTVAIGEKIEIANIPANKRLLKLEILATSGVLGGGTPTIGLGVKAIDGVKLILKTYLASLDATATTALAAAIDPETPVDILKLHASVKALGTNTGVIKANPKVATMSNIVNWLIPLLTTTNSEMSEEAKTQALLSHTYYTLYLIPSAAMTITTTPLDVVINYVVA